MKQEISDDCSQFSDEKKAQNIKEAIAQDNFYNNLTQLKSLAIGQTSTQLKTLLLSVCPKQDSNSPEKNRKFTDFHVSDGKSSARGVAFEDNREELVEELHGNEGFIISFKNVKLSPAKEGFNKTDVKYEIIFHQFSEVQVLSPRFFDFLHGLPNKTKIGILASPLQKQTQRKSDGQTYAGAFVDLNPNLNAKIKVELYMDFKPEENYPVGTSMIIENGNLYQADGHRAVRIYASNPKDVLKLDAPIFEFGEFFDVNLLSFP